MNIKYGKILIAKLLFSMFFIYGPNLNAQTYGLKFQTQDVTLDQRTELDLSPNEFLKFQDEFEISFDYKIERLFPNSLFGYVFRIINLENYNVDLLSTPTPFAGLNLVIGKNNSIIPVIYPDNSLNNWINLRIKFLLAEDKMIFYTADSFYVQDKIGFKNQDAFKIIFGANDFEQFKTTDVPSMNIKNLKIFENGKLKHQWLLDVRNGNIATDGINKVQALVKNPIWLMNSHLVWQTENEDEVKGQLMVTSDIENDRIFMVGTDELLIFSAANKTINKIKYKNKPLFLTDGYNVIYNNSDNKIYCYLVDNVPFYSLDIETGEWSDTGPVSDFLTKFRHHNRYYNPSDNSIYIFGGYGLHKYNNEIRKIDLTESTLQDLQTDDSIFRPRYLAGLGVLNDTIYILGGYGSESGNQLINPQSYYDLFGYSIKDGSLFKKFEIPRIIDDMTVANSLWIDGLTRDYYALVFEKTKSDGYLQLIKGNLDSPEIEMVGNPFPFQFLDIKAVASLFYMPLQKKLYAYTSYLTDSITTQTRIFSISYPPNKFITEPEDSQKSESFAFLYIAITLLLLSGTAGWVFLKRKKKKSVRPNVNKGKNELSATLDPDTSELMNENPKYQVIFFGGFQIFNKEFVDITNKFSPLLKELFLLIVLYTLKNNKGISSEKITEILWYDKSEKSARNNKAVNIAKLKTILDEIGNCELTKKTGYWKIIFDDHNMKSDYAHFLNITAARKNLSKQKINRLIKIIEKGAFLFNSQYEWLDEFKATVSDTIIDTLVEFAKASNIKYEPDFIIHLSDCIFNFDETNEDAMILKCKAQYCMGKHSQANATYEKFHKEYFSMYGQDYNRSFIDILDINS